MKTVSIICLALVLLSVGRGFADTPKAAAAKAPIVIVAPHSTFIQPTTQAEGRDPFYPESTRVFDSAPVATQQAHVEAPTSLTVKGVSVVNGHTYVILNNHTFGIGDEGDVISGSTHVHVHCLEIRPGTVIVEINGARHEIRY